MAGAATNWGSYIRRELNSINAASRLTDLKTLREIVNTLRVVVNRCCAAEENAEGLEEPPAASAQGAEGARLVAPDQGAEPHEWVRNSDDEYTWFKNSVTGETAWELPPGAILKENVSFPPSPTSSFASSSAVPEANENERPPPPPAPAAGPAFATAANRAAARGAVPPPSGALPPRAGRLAPNIMGCDGVTPEDCRVARVKLRRANSQLASASASVEEPVTPPGTPGREQSGGKRRRGISRKKKNRRGCNYRRTNRRFTER